MKRTFEAKTNCPVCSHSETITKDNGKPERLVTCSNCNSTYEDKLKFREVLTEQNKEIRQLFNRTYDLNDEILIYENEYEELKKIPYTKENYEEIEKEMRCIENWIEENIKEKDYCYKRIDELELELEQNA